MAEAPKSSFRKRYDAAKARRDAVAGALRAVYDLLLPGHAQSWNDAGSKTAAPSAAQIYDATASVALGNRAGDLHDKLFPPFDYWVDFEGGEAGEPGGLVGQLRETFHNAISASNFHAEMPMAIEEAVVSIGCIEVSRGNMRRPLCFEHVPAAELVVERARDGTLASTWRRYAVRFEELLVRWPQAKIPASLAQQHKDSPEASITVLDGEVYDEAKDQWLHRVELDETAGLNGDDPKLHEVERKARRRIAFRMAGASGTPWGFGPGWRAFPDAATANKTKELILKNAALAVSGIWQADDDGVLNPANIKIVPGAIIPKAQGSAGLQPLAPGNDFNVAQIVLADLRASIEQCIAGPLPPESARSSRRTAYEVSADDRRHARLDLPKTLRVLVEVHEALVLAVLDVLADDWFAGSRWFVAADMVAADTIWPASPVKRLRDLAKADEILSALANGAGLFGDLLGEVVDMKKTLRWYLDWAGFEPELLLPEKPEAPPPDPLQQAVALAAEPAAQAAGKALGAKAGEALGADLSGGLAAGLAPAMMPGGGNG